MYVRASQVSFLEVYNENVYDLLAENDATSMAAAAVVDAATAFGAAGAGAAAGYSGPGRRARLRLIGEELIMDDVTFLSVTNADEALSRLAVGFATRRVGNNTLNAQSSRSHAVLSVYVRGRCTVAVTSDDSGEATRVIERRAVLDICDLAGSEQAKKTGAEGDRLREASAINTSLSALSNVVTSLCIRARAPLTSNERPRWRDSKLTLLLKRSLGGNCATVFIATLSPSTDQWAESLSTLEFVSRARQLKTRPVQNQSELVSGASGNAAAEARARAAEVESSKLRKDIALLEAELASLRGRPQNKRIVAIANAVPHATRTLPDAAALRRALCDAAAALDASLSASTSSLSVQLSDVVSKSAHYPSTDSSIEAAALPGLLSQAFSQLGATMSLLCEARQWQPIAEALELQLATVRPLMTKVLCVGEQTLNLPSTDVDRAAVPSTGADGPRKRTRESTCSDIEHTDDDVTYPPPRKSARPDTIALNAIRAPAMNHYEDRRSSNAETSISKTPASRAECLSSERVAAADATDTTYNAGDVDKVESHTRGLYAATPCIPTPYVRQCAFVPQCSNGGGDEHDAEAVRASDSIVPHRRKLQWQHVSPPTELSQDLQQKIVDVENHHASGAAMPADAPLSTTAITAVAALRAAWAAETARRVATARTETAANFQEALTNAINTVATIERENSAIVARLSASEAEHSAATEYLLTKIADAAKATATAVAVNGPGLLRRAAGALAVLEEGLSEAVADATAAREALVSAQDAYATLQREAALAIFEARHDITSSKVNAAKLNDAVEVQTAAVEQHPSPARGSPQDAPITNQLAAEPPAQKSVVNIPSVPTVVPRVARRHGATQDGSVASFYGGPMGAHHLASFRRRVTSASSEGATQDGETQVLGTEGEDTYDVSRGEDPENPERSGHQLNLVHGKERDDDENDDDDDDDNNTAPWMALRIARTNGGSPASSSSSAYEALPCAAHDAPRSLVSRAAPVPNTTFALAFTGRAGNARVAVANPAATADASSSSHSTVVHDGVPADASTTDDASVSFVSGVVPAASDASGCNVSIVIAGQTCPRSVGQAIELEKESAFRGSERGEGIGTGELSELLQREGSQWPAIRVDKEKNARFRALIGLGASQQQ